nr:hypothetical protein Iba_chr03aCG0050 [Ipomoea batatas]
MASPSILSPPHYSTFDNHSFWDEVYLSPLRDSEPLLYTDQPSSLFSRRLRCNDERIITSLDPLAMEELRYLLIVITASPSHRRLGVLSVETGRLEASPRLKTGGELRHRQGVGQASQAGAMDADPILYTKVW